ncbi:PepSY domain-containing protein [Stutzerimonas tarimensis]|uniref:PepSY domain-containing protein n=1 Tax=Stutzerimonas tarimensis TaxID=1507735 RepID=A0ABV7T8L1_9GAMM
MMKKTLAALFASASLVLAGVAYADRPGADWISIEQAIETAKGAGYTTIYEIEADDDHWEGKGMKQDGEVHKFKIDGRSGEMKRDKKD